MTPETEALIARVLAHDAAMTKGPLRSVAGVHYVSGSECVVAQCGDYQDKELEKFSGERWQADADGFADFRTDAPKLARMLREALAHICHMATLRDDYTEEARDEALAEIEKIAREGA